MQEARGDQGVDRDVIGNEPNHRFGWLNRRDDHLRVDDQRTDQVGRRNLHVARRGPDRPPAALGFREGSAVVGLKSRAGLGARLGNAREDLGNCGRVASDCQRAGCLLEVESK